MVGHTHFWKNQNNSSCWSSMRSKRDESEKERERMRKVGIPILQKRFQYTKKLWSGPHKCTCGNDDNEGGGDR